MRKVLVILFAILFILSCQDTKKNSIKYYMNNSYSIIEINDENLIYYNLQDSIKEIFKKDNNFIIHKKTKKRLKYRFTNDTLKILDNQNLNIIKDDLIFELIEYKPDTTFGNIMGCWSYKDDKKNILCLDENYYSYFYKSFFKEKVNYKVSKYFGKFDLFISDDGLGFLRSSISLIQINSNGELILIDVKTHKENIFSNYISNYNSDLFTSWNIVLEDVKQDSIKFLRKDGSLSLLGDKLIFKKPDTIFRFLNNKKIDTFNFKLGLDTKSIFLENGNYLHIIKLTKDSLIFYDESIFLPKYRQKKYIHFKNN